MYVCNYETKVQTTNLLFVKPGALLQSTKGQLCNLQWEKISVVPFL